MEVLSLLLIKICYPIGLASTDLDHVASGTAVHQPTVQASSRNRAAQVSIQRPHELESQGRKHKESRQKPVIRDRPLYSR